MSERRLAYAVVSGEYSDYAVHCIFERREDATAYAASRNGVSVEDQTYWDEVNGYGWPDWQRDRDTERYRDLEKRIGYDPYGIAEFDFYVAGEVPVVSV